MGLRIWAEDKKVEDDGVPDSYYNSKHGKSFTWKQVSTHNTINDCWIIIRGSVYNVTKFISKHPGGESLILIGGGRDCTQVFETYHNPARIVKVLEKYRIGYTVDTELPTFPRPNAFNITLRARVDQYFKSTKQDPKFHWSVYLKYTTIYSSIFLSYYLQFYQSIVVNNWLYSLLAAIILGIGCAQIGLMPMHDSSHCSITHSSKIWWLIGSTHDFLNGASYVAWLYQHMLGHHPYTNIVGADPDVAARDPDYRRIIKKQQWFAHYAKQHLWVPIAYAFLAMKVRMQDGVLLFIIKRFDQIRINPLLPFQKALFWGGKAFFIFYRWMLPYFLGNSLSRVAVLFAISDMVTSYWLAFMFQSNHVVEDVKWPQPDANNSMSIDWCELQLETTQDYQHDSLLWATLSGSLNYQAIHHIFPNINQAHYPALTLILKTTAQEFGIRHRIKDTFLEAFKGHLDYLKNMGQQPTKYEE